MRAALLLLLLASTALAQLHPSLPEPGTLDGLGVNIRFTDGAPSVPGGPDTSPQSGFLPGELEMIRAAGFRWVRMDFSWAATEPEPARYDFSKFDSILAALEKVGLRAYFILDYGHPKFADAGDRHPFTSRAGTQEFRDAFAKWAVAAVGHFKRRGIVWELWNEPNIAGFWKPKPDAQQYIALAKTVAAALEKAGLRKKSRTFPPGTKREAAGECLVGPATSVIDLPFLDACFAAGLLEVFDAISVHPYRQGAPESVAEEYRALRLLIRRHCAADALPLGTYDPSRPNPARRIPILSGEWGYSAAWLSLGEDEAAREATQAKYLPRMFLTNVANDIPLSIWHDWRDDGDDPKEAGHRFGIVRRKPTGDAKQPFEPKPAYAAMKEMCEELKGMRFRNQIHEPSPLNATVVTFAGDNDSRAAFWLHSKNEVKPEGMIRYSDGLRLTVPGDYEVRSGAGSRKAIREEDDLRLTPTDSVSWLKPKTMPEALRLAASWEKSPLDCYVAQRESAMLRLALTNTTTGPIEVSEWVRDEEVKRRVTPGTAIVGSEEIPFTRDPNPNEIISMVDVAAPFPLLLRQRTKVVSLIPIHASVYPRLKRGVVVELRNPSGRPFDGSLRFLDSNNGCLGSMHQWLNSAVRINEGQKTQRVTIDQDDRALTPRMREEIEMRRHWSLCYFLSATKLGQDDSFVGDFVAGGRMGSPVLKSGFSESQIAIFQDGDAGVASTQRLADGQPAEGASVSGTPSVGLRYRFGAGWKFVRIEPKDAAARKIEGDPRAFGIWVHGDGQGGTPCIRLRDAKGQTHEVRGEPITWKGWRYVTFPLRPAADSGQTMIPLPESGAEQRVSWSHWGGANDGEVHEPIEWDALFLLDGNRQAMEGEIFLSAPTLVY